MYFFLFLFLSPSDIFPFENSLLINQRNWLKRISNSYESRKFKKMIKISFLSIYLYNWTHLEQEE